jgi:hypothetical protein
MGTFWFKLHIFCTYLSMLAYMGGKFHASTTLLPGKRLYAPIGQEVGGTQGGPDHSGKEKKPATVRNQTLVT